MTTKDELRPGRRARTAPLAMLVAGAAMLVANAATAEDLRPIKQQQPKYPRAAERLGIDGWVNLEFNVDENGNVVAPHVVQSSPPGVFDAAAIRALARWKYEATGSLTKDEKVKVVFKH